MRGRRYRRDPVAEVVAEGADVIVNLAGSPFTRAKREGRPALMSALARAHGRPVVLVNQVGAHDDLIFDGASLVVGPDGAAWARAAAFEEDLLVTELAPGGPARVWPESDEAAVLDALALGVRDYARRCGLKKAILGLSGGIDSALVACIAVRALGPENVLGVGMPSRYSSEGSVLDARALAEALGIAFQLVPIEPLFAPYAGVLEGPLAALGPTPAEDVTFENLQARLRMTVLMALANRASALLLNTGNKSEIACGYCTLYGDMAGGFAVIKDVPKTLVFSLARHRNRQAAEAGRQAPLPESTLERPPTAELRPDQLDEDTLPPYPVLDAVLAAYIEEDASPEELVARGFEPGLVERVLKMVDSNEYKRRQAPPGIRISPRAFGRDRRLPITDHYRRKAGKGSISVNKSDIDKSTVRAVPGSES
jgi:NAD+ synthase (glutamine-hydrolysing)